MKTETYLAYRLSQLEHVPAVSLETEAIKSWRAKNIKTYVSRYYKTLNNQAPVKSFHIIFSPCSALSYSEGENFLH